MRKIYLMRKIKLSANVKFNVKLDSDMGIIYVNMAALNSV